MNEVPVGDLLDSRGLLLDLADEDLLVSAVIIAAVMVPGENYPRISIGTTEGMGPIEQTGLLSAAQTLNAAGWADAVRAGDDE